MTAQVYFEDLAVGHSIPELIKRPTTQQLVMWAAGSGDFYPLHYDKDFAISTGLDGVIVHGALKHAWLGELLHRLAAPNGRVLRVSCSYRGMDLPSRPFSLCGRVTAKRIENGQHLVDLEIWGEDDQKRHTTPGTGVVALPSRTGSTG